MTLEDLSRMISRGFAALADGQEAIATELRATRLQLARIKGQRELDQEAHEADLNALGTQVADVDRRLRLVPGPKDPAE